MSSDRFQYPCLPPHRNHKWNLEDVCIHCQKPKVMAHERARAWRSDQILSQPEKKQNQPKPKTGLTWSAIRVRRAVYQMKTNL